jgi:hypothetical protein
LNDPKFSKAYDQATALRAKETFKDVYKIADREKKTHVDVAADRLRCMVRLKAATIANPALKRRRSAEPKKKPFQLPDELEVEIVRPEANEE